MIESPHYRERLGQIGLVALYAVLLVRTFAHVTRTGRITSGLSLVTVSVALWFIVTRRPATKLDQSWSARIVTMAGTVGPLLFRPADVPGWLPDPVTSLLAMGAGLFTLAGFAALRGSFGLVPAHRGLVSRGPYRWIRHPLYTSYLCGHIAFVLAYPTLYNTVIWIIADGSQLIRLGYEERLLATDPQYQAYRQMVRWRLVPGVF